MKNIVWETAKFLCNFVQSTSATKRAPVQLNLSDLMEIFTNFATDQICHTLSPEKRFDIELFEGTMPGNCQKCNFGPREASGGA